MTRGASDVSLCSPVTDAGIVASAVCVAVAVAVFLLSLVSGTSKRLGALWRPQAIQQFSRAGAINSKQKGTEREKGKGIQCTERHTGAMRNDPPRECHLMIF